MGKVGPLAGYAMKRGTLLLNHAPNELPVTFNDCGIHPFGFLELLIPTIQKHGEPFADLVFDDNYARRWMGDVANVGRGEILTPT
jgi:formylmethanofuran dehydrogenase subunit C